MRILTALLALLATPAAAQTYPSPIFAALTVNGALSIGGALTLSGNATLSGALAVTGDATLAGALAVTGATSLQTLNVAGLTDFAQSPIITDCSGYAYGNAATQITCSTTVPVADIAPIAANTLVGNATSGSATPTAVAIPSCSSTGQALNYTSGSGFTCAAAATRDIGGRLTLSQGAPIMSGSVSNATTLYYTPYSSDYVVIWDGSALQLYSFTELSMSTTDATKNPAGVGATACYDAFVWNDSGTLRLSHGPAWSSCTTPTRGYTFTQRGAFFFNTSAIINGPGAGLGLWVGSFASNSSSKIDWIFGDQGAGGVASSLNVWNQYNRVAVTSRVWDTNTFYAYDSTNWRAAGGSTNNRVTFMSGSTDTQIDARLDEWVYLLNNATLGGLDAYNGVCVDCTNNYSGTAGYGYAKDSNATMYATYTGVIFGKHFIQATERAGAPTTTHLFGYPVLTFKAFM